jgi:hypothetical protein
MFNHPSIHTEIARQLQEDRLARSKSHRTAKAALAGRHEDRGRPLTEPAGLPKPSRTTTARRPQRVNA